MWYSISGEEVSPQPSHTLNERLLRPPSVARFSHIQPLTNHSIYGIVLLWHGR